MSLIIHAPNVHQGGGKTLLLGLLNALDGPSYLILDDRLTDIPALPDGTHVSSVKASLFSRLAAERRLQQIATSQDTVLCFGNLPPLFRNKAKVYVYMQNRYLSASRSLKGLSGSARFRHMFERVWLSHCLRQAIVLVQTETMAQEFAENFNRRAQVRPFLPGFSPSRTNEAADWQGKSDFIYVASAEPHKNHRRLVQGWILLAEQGLRPSLLLTLDENDRTLLNDWIREQIARHDLRISWFHGHETGTGALYSRAKALVYPSLFESLGLPLLEADRAGLAIIASERDYVRDVVNPAHTFDPESPLSIARAVKRFMEVDTGFRSVPGPDKFLEQLRR